MRDVLDLIDIVCRRRISYMSHASQSDVDIQLVHKLCLVECTIRMGEYLLCLSSHLRYILRTRTTFICSIHTSCQYFPKLLAVISHFISYDVERGAQHNGSVAIRVRRNSSFDII